MAFPQTKLPLHYRANRAEQRDAVRNRYQRGRIAASAQVAALQNDPAFLAEARGWYARGYKDWVLVSAIVNSLGNEVVRERDLGPRPGQPIPKPLPPDEMLQAVKGRVLPTAAFLGDRFDHMVMGFEIAALAGYQLRQRTHQLDSAKLRAFLRDRLDFYDFDYKHAPLFGDPPGSWPEF